MKLNGVDLFSGIGGLSLGLEHWVRPIAYCESDPYAQAVLLQRMRSGQLPPAPVWDDVRTLCGKQFASPVEIIVGGFPCQDISCAGLGEGLEGSRSGLFFEIVRLTSELRPDFVFLENVPTITVRGLDRICMEFTSLGFDCRWTTVSAAEVGAPHLRERWFFLARANSTRLWEQSVAVSRRGGAPVTESNGAQESLANAKEFGSKRGLRQNESQQDRNLSSDSGQAFPNPSSGRQSVFGRPPGEGRHALWSGVQTEGRDDGLTWPAEPNVGRVVDGVSNRVDRLRCLGNAVVPRQAQVAFERLLGL